jgi:NAD-dependent histone deacetylase SIR2
LEVAADMGSISIQLPPAFIESIPLLHQADLLIVMGTSLTVYPFARLATLVLDNTPRVLMNLERVGDFASSSDDVLLLGKCDEMVRVLCRELGWEEELDDLWMATADSVEVDEDALEKKEKESTEEKKAEGKDDAAGKRSSEDRMKADVDKLTEAIGRGLIITEKEQASSKPKKEKESTKASDGSTGTTKAGSSGEGKL